jgi:hypothetical protein
MIGIFNTISIEEVEIFRGNNFSLEREWIYAAEIETCTGKRCADVVGWRYKDLTIQWDNLPQDQLQTILDLDGSEVNMTFTNEQNQSVTEAVIPLVTTAQITRLTDPNGNVAWSGIGLQVRFINAHN